MDQGASSVICRDTSSRMNEAESWRKETTPSTFTTKKMKTLPNEVIASSLEADSGGPLRWIMA